MKAAIFAFSRQGCKTARAIGAQLEKNGWTTEAFAPPEYAPRDFEALPGSITRFTGTFIGKAQALVYVGACGIAVRSVAPHIKSKSVDPAVICVDEKAGFVIPILSGHIGGGNRLAAIIAQGLGATPVITTATDVNGRFSVDAWAAEQGFFIGGMLCAKRVSAAILERDIPFCADKPIIGNLPQGLFAGQGGELGICVSPRTKRPFEDTLSIIPPVLALGIGCRRGIAKEKIEAAVRETLEANALEFRAVKEVRSVALKAQEEGLLDFCKEHALPLYFYTPEELMSVQGEFSSSQFVEGVTGADNVCERSAVHGGHKLIVDKTVHGGVTVAAAEQNWEVRF